MVEVDPETGEIGLVRYVAVDDVGNVINPMIVDGQVQGGITHGIAQALWEEAVYDENGQLVTGALLDYAVPKAHMLISYDLGSDRDPLSPQPAGGQGGWGDRRNRIAGGHGQCRTGRPQTF